MPRELFPCILLLLCVDHTRSGVVYNFGPVCLYYMSVCLYVCQMITSERVDVWKFIFANAVYLQGIRVTFVYEGHWVKVKVTGAKGGPKFLFSQGKTSFYKNRTMKFVSSMGFLTMADQMV